MKDGVGNAEELRRYHGPLLVVHGTADEVIPIEEGRADFAAAAAADRTFVPVAGKGQVAAVWSVEADDAMAAFFSRHVPGNQRCQLNLAPLGSASGAAAPVPLMRVN